MLMKQYLLTSLSVILLLCFASISNQSKAASLLLDFGPTTTTGSDATLSMGHFAGAVPNTETSWNKIVNADATSGLVYSDGSAATGVSVIVGRSGAGISDSINYSIKTISSSALGSAENWGIYTNSSPLKDGIFATGTFSANTNALGIRVDGLAAGTYTLYISGRNSNTGYSAAQRFFAGNGAVSTGFSFSTDTTSYVDEANSATTPGTGRLPTQADAITSTFAYGDNCTHLVVTLESGDSLYLVAIGIATNEYRGFLNSVEIVPGAPVLTNFPATVGVQPNNVTAYEGSSVVIDGAKFGGVPPLYFQWYSNGVAINGATNTSLTLSNATASLSANYNVSVSNQINVAVSSNATLTIVPFYDTARMTNIWNLLPGDRFYVTTNNNNNYERGLAYDPVTGDLLLAAQSPTNNVVVLNATNGAEKYFLRMDDLTAPGSASLNTVGVADDGSVYVGNVVADASSSFYKVEWWANDGADTSSYNVYADDPGFGTPAAGLRWGDCMIVRGSGTGTQILITPGSGTNGNYVCLLQKNGGGTFDANLITITNLPSTNSFARFGVAFGPGTNTFWAKTLNQQLFLVQFDLASGMGGVIYTETNGIVPNGFRFISTDSNQKWMAGVFTLNSSLVDNVRLYDISAYTNGPVLADQELYTTANRSSFLNGDGTGVTVFGGNYLFALDSNNGIKAFLINTNLLPFNIISAVPQPDSKMVFTWESVGGHTYQIQSRASLSAGSWSDVGSPVPASGTTTSATNSVSEPAQFYRIQGQ